MNIQDSLTKLKGIIPDSVLTETAQIADKFGINTNLRLAHFLAQCAHESIGFKALRENLSYSDPNRIVEIFKHDIDSNHNRVIEPSELAKAKSLAKNPAALANFVYANQNGNGNEPSGDGYNFRGRGYIQLTGRVNYAAFSKFINEDCVAQPDLVATKYPLASAAFFFNNKNLWKICDKGADDATIVKVTQAVNGGQNGFAERKANFIKYYSKIK